MSLEGENEKENTVLENKNEDDYHNIMHPDPKKGRTANIVLLIIFLLVLLPFNLYAVYSTFGEIYDSLANINVPDNIIPGDAPNSKKVKKQIEQSLKASGIAVGAEMTSTVIVVCFLLLYCIGALINYLRINSQKRKGEHVIFLISCFLIFAISLQNIVPLGILLYGEKLFSKNNPSSHIIATFASQVINVLVTIGIIIAYMVKPNSVLN